MTYYRELASQFIQEERRNARNPWDLGYKIMRGYDFLVTNIPGFKCSLIDNDNSGGLLKRLGEYILSTPVTIWVGNGGCSSEYKTTIGKFLDIVPGVDVFEQEIDFLVSAGNGEIKDHELYDRIVCAKKRFAQHWFDNECTLVKAWPVDKLALWDR